MDKILIIEDDKNVRNSLIDLLEFSGYNTDSAENGRQALKKIDNNTPDLIISDIMMPEVDGVALLQILRSKPNTASIPFIFLTGKSDYVDIRIGMDNGADDYISKPFKAADILKAVQTRISKKNDLIKNFLFIKDNITHSLPNVINNSLLSISGYAEILVEEADAISPEQTKNFANNINIAGKNLARLIKKFLAYTDSVFLILNSAANKNLLSSKIANIGNITKQIVCEYALENNCEDLIDLDVNDAKLSISPRHYQLMIRELINNAVIHNIDNKPIQVIGKIIDNKYNLTVTNAPEMKKEIQEIILTYNPLNNNIFNETNPKLGLVTIKNIMEFYNGSFNLDNTKKGITKVLLQFPLS